MYFDSLTLLVGEFLAFEHGLECLGETADHEQLKVSPTQIALDSISDTFCRDF